MLISLITISPYLIRNLIIFDKITIVETSGYNLWKGNHPLAVKNSLVEGLDFSPERDIKLSEQIDEIPRNKFYRINRDNFLKKLSKLFFDTDFSSMNFCVAFINS